MMEESSWWQSLRRLGMRPGLERSERLLGALDHPERRFPAVHVGGTNGKGSTVALMAGAFTGAGLRVGRYTSPDLGDVRERMTVDGQLLSEERYAELAARVERAAAGLAESPTRFEALTALAFLAFAEAKVDVAVVEVGLGGRFDATNVLERPLAVVFVPIALDHTAILGPTVAHIAEDKAGIIKPGVPVVSAVQSPPARNAILRSAREAGVSVRWARGTLVAAGRDFVAARVGGDEVRAQLAGPHQVRNLALAWTAVREVAPAFELNLTAARQGLGAATWPCRLEWIPGNPPVLLDAAHNLHGTHALCAALASGLYPRPRHLVFGVLQDKPGAAMLRALLPHVDSVTLVRAESSRAGDPAAWTAGRRLGLPFAVKASVEAGVETALSQARADGPGAMVLVTGSFDVVGPARRRLVQRGAPSDTAK
ncbi:MAG: bifunctional folylpolyglutamate synthase/dihydrofolate synthase [Clostridia bacterium]